VVWSKQGRAARTRRGVLNVESFIHMQGIVARQKADADRILALRDYYDGEHPVLLTNRQREYLGDLLSDQEFPFAHNIVRSVIDTLRERLAVTGLGIEGTSEDDAATPEAQVSAAMWEWWTKSRLDSGQIRLYRRALRDGKAYILVDFDPERNRPRFTIHHVDAGDREPGIMLYRDPTNLDVVLMAIRHFVPDNPINPAEVGRERKTIYLPDQVRKYVMAKSGQWEPYMEPGDMSWPLPWVDRRGRPLGVLAIEFENPGGSEVEQIIGLQNALNKAWLDLMAAADTSGFPLISVEYDSSRLGPRLGAASDSDADNEGSDELRLSPGRAIETDDAAVHRIEAADMSQMIAVIDRIEQAISGVSRTPSYYLKPVGGSDVPSGEALKQLESGLVRRAEERQLVFGQAWQDVFALAYRVNQAFGPSLPELDEPSISVTWADANVRNELAEAQTAEAHQRLGVPQATLWREIGYTPEEIDEFKRSKIADTNAQVAGIAAMLRTDQSRQGGQQPGQPAQNGAAQRNGTGVQQ
jgi:hypothetical protein